jgi:SpoIVB peptidase S55
MHWTSWVKVALVGGVLASAPFEVEVARAGSQARADILTADQIHPGMKGYGLTVFDGTKPERFGVEVLNVVKNWRTQQDAILIKTFHPRLDVANVVSGMSGSPIYIDGKMIGAYAYGPNFGKEPVAIVTPISNMLADLERPLPKSIFGWPLDPLPALEATKRRSSRETEQPGARLAPIENSATLYSGNARDYKLYEHAKQLGERIALGRSETDGVRRVGTRLLLGGMGDLATEMARQLFAPLGLDPLQAGGGDAPDPTAPQHFEDGGAIAVQLVRGDLSASFLGTVTRVEGDRLVAFGHPMLGAGVTALPTAVASVSWVWASESSSFKMGAAVRPLGALVNDRQASIVVSEAAKAPTVRVSLHIDGAPGVPYRDWNIELAHEKFLTPSLLAMALGEAIQATAAERQDISWTAESRVKIKGQQEIKLEDFGVAMGGTPEPRDLAQWQLVAAVGGVLNNPWQPAVIESVNVHIALNYARDILRLREARAIETEVDAGQPVHIVLTLVPFAGPLVTRTISVPVPKHLAGSTLQLAIRPGHSVPREKAQPDSLAEFVSNLEDPIYPPKSVVVSYATGAGVAFKGHVAENLPPGALDSIRQNTASFSPDTFKSNRYHVVALDHFMVGSDTVSVKVRPVLR